MNKMIKETTPTAKNGLMPGYLMIKEGDILNIQNLGISIDELSLDFLYNGEHRAYIYSYGLNEKDFLRVVIEDIYDELAQDALNATVRVLDVSLWIYQ